MLAFHDIGEISLEHLDDPDSAVSAFARALERDPDFAPSRLALDALWRKTGALEALREQYERDARRLQGFAALQAWLCVVDLSEALEQHDEAVDALRQAMEIDPANAALRREYQGRLARAGRWKLYVQTALNELEHSDNDEASAAIYLFIAQLYELALDDLETAHGAVSSALELKPDWRFARDELLRLLERRGRWAELVERLVAIAGNEEDSRLAAARYYQAGMVAERRL